MKKRILAMLLSALMLISATACQTVPENEIDTPQNSSLVEEPNENLGDIESEYDLGTDPTWSGSLTYNGVHRDSEITYTFDPNSGLSIHIADWNEDHLVTFLSDEDINAVKYSATAIGVNNERAFLLLKRSNKITVVSFKKGSPNEMVINLNIDENVYRISGNFINENIGYIFAFAEVSGHHAKGSSKLSHLFKTEDGGNTWSAISVQSAPLISLSENVVFSKMISEDIGVISGRYWADDYDFCQRTLLTTNGGRNWECISTLPKINNLCSPEVIDFTKYEGSYILTVRHITSENGYEYAKYKSSDLNVWMHID